MFFTRKKLDFTPIWESIRQIDAVAGGLVFRDPSVKRTIKEMFFALSMPSNVVSSIILISSTLIVTNFKLISVIICSSLLLMMSYMYCVVIKTATNKHLVMDLFKWCENLYDIEKSFSGKIQQMARKHVFKISAETTKMIKYLKLIIYLDGCVLNTLVPFVINFLPFDIFPKFTPAMPLYLPFKQQDTWFAFTMTSLVQAVYLVPITNVGVLQFVIFSSVIIHILGYLDIIEDAVGKLKDELQLKLNGPKESAIINETYFNEWIQIITDMITDVNDVLSTFSKLYGETFLLLQIASFGGMFTSGLLCTVMHQQYVYAIGVLLHTALHFMVCYANEKILEKFEDVKDAFYDIPWYQLDTKQRKMLMIVKNCDKTQKGFNAVGLHSLTIERFGVSVKTGYSNLLILKDLVQK